MPEWFSYALGAAGFYGLHQVFTKFAADKIGDGIGALVVESSAVLTIAAYLGWLYFAGRWAQPITKAGVLYSSLTGLCVGAGTVLFFALFQKGAPLSAVPGILAAGSAIMAVVGVTAFGETMSVQRGLGIAFSIIGLYLVR